MKPKLSDIYSKKVAGKGEAFPSQVSSTNNYIPAPRERDPKIKQLEQETANKMQEALQKEQPKSSPATMKHSSSASNITEVGFEQALKELSSMLKSTNNKS